MVVGDFPIETDTIVIGAGPGGIICSNSCSSIRTKSTIVKVILVVFA